LHANCIQRRLRDG